MQVERPDFSIVIPTHNRAPILNNTLEALLQMDYASYEVIVVDDGSTDDTRRRVEERKCEKISYYYTNNRERACARNYGISKATGRYITFLDSDDILLPHALQEANRITEQFSNPEWLHLAYEVRSTSGKVISRQQHGKDVRQQLLTGNHLSCLGVFIRADIARQNSFDEDINLIGSEDYELWLRLAAQYDLKYSNEICGAVIHHDARSVVSFSSGRLITRLECCIEKVMNNRLLWSRYAGKEKVFLAHRYLYLSLHLLLAGDKSMAAKYWWKAFVAKPGILVHRKTIAIARKMIVP